MKYLYTCVAGAGLIAVTACAKKPAADTDTPGPVQAAAPSCVPSVGKLPSGTSIGSIAGSHRVTLVATTGRRSGRSVVGDLQLQSAANGSLSGTSTIALDSVGATAPGPVPADKRYSLTGLQWSSTSAGVTSPEIAVRFGHIPTPANTQAIEGAYMVMHLNKVSADGFTGRWESETGDMLQPARAGGHFCAQK